MKRPGTVRGVLLQVGAVALLGGITAVCLPLIWAKMVVVEDQGPMKTAEETDALD